VHVRSVCCLKCDLWCAARPYDRLHVCSTQSQPLSQTQSFVRQQAAGATGSGTPRSFNWERGGDKLIDMHALRIEKLPPSTISVLQELVDSGRGQLAEGAEAGRDPMEGVGDGGNEAGRQVLPGALQVFLSLSITVEARESAQNQNHMPEQKPHGLRAGGAGIEYGYTARLGARRCVLSWPCAVRSGNP
jgi:hypothetical protein